MKESNLPYLNLDRAEALSSTTLDTISAPDTDINGLVTYAEVLGSPYAITPIEDRIAHRLGCANDEDGAPALTFTPGGTLLAMLREARKIYTKTPEIIVVELSVPEGDEPSIGAELILPISSTGHRNKAIGWTALYKCEPENRRLMRTMRGRPLLTKNPYNAPPKQRDPFTGRGVNTRAAAHRGTLGTRG